MASSSSVGTRPLATVARPEYYGRGLPVEVEPGTKWAYSNHGFAALGQIIEDVSGLPLDRYMRERIFEPLGMEYTDLVRSERVHLRLATGYVLGSRGLKPVAEPRPDLSGASMDRNREIPTPGGGGIYSTAADIARYISALQRMYTGEGASVLRPESVASMFQPHF